MIDTKELRFAASKSVRDLALLPSEVNELLDRLEAAEKAITEAYRREYATVQEAIKKEREACAITAWAIGMELYKKQFDAREVGASCASAIRARVKYDTSNTNHIHGAKGE
jgi:hypothetical protein